MCKTEHDYQTPLPFYVTQTINPFPNFIISANHEKGEEFQPKVHVSLIPLIVSIALVSFRLTKAFKCSRLLPSIV